MTLQVAKSVDDKSEQMIWFSLVVVDVSQAKAAIMQAALATRAALQVALQLQWHETNQQVVAR
jgi:hypothetical protein